MELGHDAGQHSRAGNYIFVRGFFESGNLMRHIVSQLVDSLTRKATIRVGIIVLNRWGRWFTLR